MFTDARALDIDVNVHRMGKSWSQIDSEPSLTCGPVDDLDFKDMVYVDCAGRDTSKCCLPGTRKSILSEIKDWIYRTGEDAQWIFWLSGTAGKGKSAQYLCRHSSLVLQRPIIGTSSAGFASLRIHG